MEVGGEWHLAAYLCAQRPAMIHPETIATHTIQLFDDAKSRTDALVGFVRQGLQAGDNVLVVATRVHWEPAAARLLERGLHLDADIAAYRLTVYDATGTLDGLLRRGRLQHRRFNEIVATRIRRLRTAGARLRAYGEMVDLLAGEGDFANAVRLEELWNELMLHEPLDLLCGYSSAHFGDRRSMDALSRICHAHSHLRFSPYDSLGGSLLQANPRDPSETMH